MCTEQSPFPNTLEIINLLYSGLMKHNSIWWFSYWCAARYAIYCLEKEKLHMASKDPIINNCLISKGS